MSWVMACVFANILILLFFAGATKNEYIDFYEEEMK